MSSESENANAIEEEESSFLGGSIIQDAVSSEHTDQAHSNIMQDEILSNSSRRRRLSVSTINENTNTSGQRSFYNLYR